MKVLVKTIFHNSSMTASEPLRLNILKRQSKQAEHWKNTIYWLFKSSKDNWGNIKQSILQK